MRGSKKPSFPPLLKYNKMTRTNFATILSLKELKDFEKEINESYWKGFYDGMKNSVKHNINLLKSQLNENTVKTNKIRGLIKSIRKIK
jgi:hypothetical protein